MYTDEDSIITFRLGFNGHNETLMLRVDVLSNAIYQIVCEPETKLSQENINNGIIAMNNYNLLRAQVVSGCIRSEGNIIFWLGRNIDGNTFSEQAFAADLHMVIREADIKTAQIYKQAYNPNS